MAVASLWLPFNLALHMLWVTVSLLMSKRSNCVCHKLASPAFAAPHVCYVRVASECMSPLRVMYDTYV